MHLLFLILLPLFASAETFKGVVTAKEVTPIYENQYVSDTCTDRTEYPCGCEAETGCGSCTSYTSYECGGYQDVRVGSKLVHELIINYEFTVKNHSSESTAVLQTKEGQSYDSGFSATDLLKSSLVFGGEGLQVFVTTSKLEEVSNDGLKKEMKITGDFQALAPKDVNTILERTKISRLENLEFDPDLKNFPALALQVCVYKDRRFSDRDKWLGCENISSSALSSGAVTLKEILFRKARGRSLSYYFNWSLDGAVVVPPVYHQNTAVIYLER